LDPSSFRSMSVSVGVVCLLPVVSLFVFSAIEHLSVHVSRCLVHVLLIIVALSTYQCRILLSFALSRSVCFALSLVSCGSWPVIVCVPVLLCAIQLVYINRTSAADTSTSPLLFSCLCCLVLYCFHFSESPDS